MTFNLGAEEYGIDIVQVQEVICLVNIVSVPNAPHFVEGVIELRSKVIPVINLRKRLGMPEEEKTRNSRIIVADIGGETIGLIVDSVSEVLRIPLKTLQPLPEVAVTVDSQFLKGVARLDDRLIILLDFSELLSRDEIRELGSVEDGVA